MWKSGNKTGKEEHEKWVTKLFAGQIELRDTTFQEPMWKALQGCPSEGQE